MYKSTESNNHKSHNGVNRSFANYIPSTKLHLFETLFKSLSEYYGGSSKAEKELKVAKGIVNRSFKDKRLSQHYATKILNKFNEVREIKKRMNNG